MSTGGGNSFFESALDVGLNYFSAGTAGFKSDEGGIGANGITTQGLKDITGATAAEEANKAASDRFAAEKVAAEEQRKQNQAQSAANELQKSRSASSARGGVSSPSSTGQSRFSSLGSDEADFLGL